MDYEAEINNLQKRVEELETCCAEFRSCKGSMAERIAAVEKKTEYYKGKEVKGTLEKKKEYYKGKEVKGEK